MRVSRKVKIRKKSKTLRRKFVKSKQIQENKSKKSEESEREMRVSPCGDHHTVWTEKSKKSKSKEEIH